MRKFNRPPGISKEDSGPIQEINLLGSLDTADTKYRAACKAYFARNKELIDRIAERKPVSIEERNRLFLEGTRLVESFPAEDPLNPAKPLLCDLRLQFAEKLGLEDKDIDRVRAFSSVGTPIDALYGADAFLKIDGEKPGEEPVYITFDFTTRPEKTTTPADVLIRNLPDPDLEGPEYVKIVDQAALEAYKVYLRRKGGRAVY